MKIVDKTGKVYRSEAWYALQDPISGHRFEPGELTKVDPNPWIEGQPAIKLVEEAAPAAESLPKSKTPSK